MTTGQTRPNFCFPFAILFPSVENGAGFLRSVVHGAQADFQNLQGLWHSKSAMGRLSLSAPVAFGGEQPFFFCMQVLVQASLMRQYGE